MRFPTSAGSPTAAAAGQPRLFAAAALGFAICFWVATGAAAWFVWSAVSGLPDAAGVRSAGAMARATTITDVRGRHAFTLFQEQRLQVPLARVSPRLLSAVIATEDQRFHGHGGIDVIRVMGAAWNNMRAGRAEQGGSTITQQLARLSFLTTEKTFRRKLQEALLAVRLERTFSKDEILELYLNKAYFGDGLYGVEAASLGYFGVHASELDIAQAALIAGLVKSPSTYSPTVSPERAVARRNVVLNAMRDAGAIDKQALTWALAREPRFIDGLRHEEAHGQYFKEEVRQELVEMFGWERVHLDGLRVETTLDLDLQKAAEREVARSLAEIEGRRAPSGRGEAADPLEAALVALDPVTGEVRALVGGRSFERSRFNRAVQARRQPGSAFKPFVYAAALENGFTPATVISTVSQPVATVQGAWVPEDGHVDRASMTMREALRASSNRAAVRMLLDVGIPKTVQYAKQLGVGTMPAVPSLALGSGEVTLLTLTSAFAAFANEGIVTHATLIRRVTTREGTVLYEAAPESHRALRPSTAYLITSMLEGVVDAGTAARVRRMGFRLPAAGKTGTTNDYRDAWFVGYTPRIVTGVWVGYDQPRTIVNGGYAAELAVPLWTRFMLEATRGHEPERFRAPSTVGAVQICRLTGKRASDTCRHEGTVYAELFERGTEPDDTCLHPRIDRGLLYAAAPAPSVQPASSASSAPVVVTAATPSESVAAAAEASEGVEEAPAAPKKRGFWSRLFRRGASEAESSKDGR